MRLIIVHYHLRPGGIRRIVEVATPHILRACDGSIDRVLLATGEAADRKWNDFFQHHVGGVSVEFLVEPAFGYLSEQRAKRTTITKRIRQTLQTCLAGADRHNTVVWAHNLGIARNLLLTRELVRACEQGDITLLAHHHDWWFDNRWIRWLEMRRFGFRTLGTAAHTVLPPAKGVRHFAINHADARVLRRQFGNRVSWLPNLTERTPPPGVGRVRAACEWLQGRLGDRAASVWILPCRLLRRKNVAEALLLTRWLRPEAWLVTTGGVSSAEEQPYARRLQEAALQHHWRLRLGVLAGDEAHKPSVPELLAASECVMLTSIQEGFGLPYLEAAATGRPLMARSLPNIAPDLARFGFAFPQYYGELMVSPTLFDWGAETGRQSRLFRVWRRGLPSVYRPFAAAPILLRHKGPPVAVPFSRLTLTAQIEVLARPARDSWDLCRPLNPFLDVWRRRCRENHLQTSRWPAQAADWLSGEAYARRWTDLAFRKCRPVLDATRALRAQDHFVRWKLGVQYQYPLLWSKES